MKQTILHFGAGALGKGLVIPVLHESDCQVIVVDADTNLVDFLQKEKAYTMYIPDDPQTPVRRIPIAAACHLEDEETILSYLKDIHTVTTAVRRENLDGVARLLVKGWASQDCRHKLVLCCENVEHVSAIFKAALQKAASPETAARIAQIAVPDTVVDRGCSRHPSEPFSVLTESYHEIGVDADAVPDTRIARIPSLKNLRQCFYRKRFLVNTYADLLSYFAIDRQIPTFGAAVRNKDLQAYLAPYMEQIIRPALLTEFSMSESEYAKWHDFYQGRLSRSTPESDARPLDTIARGMWTKLQYEERIFYPIALLARRGIDITAGIRLLADLIRIEQKKEPMTKEQAVEKLTALWGKDETGMEILRQVMQALASLFGSE